MMSVVGCGVTVVTESGPKARYTNDWQKCCLKKGIGLIH